MDMNEAIQASLKLLYCRAWVSLHAKDAHHWTDQQIQDAFHLLAPPMVSFPEWMARRGFSDAMEIEKKPSLEEGPGWAIANDEEGKRQMEAKIKALQAGAKVTGGA